MSAALDIEEIERRLTSFNPTSRWQKWEDYPGDDEWTIGANVAWSIDEDTGELLRPRPVMYDNVCGEVYTEALADFIVNAPQDIAALVAEVKRLREVSS